MPVCFRNIELALNNTTQLGLISYRDAWKLVVPDETMWDDVSIDIIAGTSLDVANLARCSTLVMNETDLDNTTLKEWTLSLKACNDPLTVEYTFCEATQSGR